MTHCRICRIVLVGGHLMVTSNEFVPSLKLSTVEQRWENMFREAIIRNECHFHQSISGHETSFGLEMTAEREIGFEV